MEEDNVKKRRTHTDLNPSETVELKSLAIGDARKYPLTALKNGKRRLNIP